MQRSAAWRTSDEDDVKGMARSGMAFPYSFSSFPVATNIRATSSFPRLMTYFVAPEIFRGTYR